MTDARTAEARARCEAATKGPWDYGTPGKQRAAAKATGVVALVSNAVVVIAGMRPVATMTQAYRTAEVDAAWIATACNDLPDALDDLAELRERVRLLEAVAVAAVEVDRECRNCEVEWPVVLTLNTALAAAGYGKEAPDAHA
jgi:hypothetical protein